MDRSRRYIKVAVIGSISIGAGVYFYIKEETASEQSRVAEAIATVPVDASESTIEIQQDATEEVDAVEEHVALTGRIDYVANPELWTNTPMAPIGNPVPDEDYTKYVAEALLILNDTESTVEEKCRILEEIGQIYDPMILPAVLCALEDESSDVRMEAVQAIRFMDHPCVVPAVEKALNDTDPEIRADAIDALLNVKDISVNPALEKALWDENPDVRDEAATVLSTHESPDTLPILEKMLDSEEAEHQELAVDVLEDIPDTRAIDMLIYKGLTAGDTASEAAQAVLEKLSGRQYILTENWQKWWEDVKSTAPADHGYEAWEEWLYSLRNHNK
jgi:hypothetical protein